MKKILRESQLRQIIRESILEMMNESIMKEKVPTLEEWTVTELFLPADKLKFCEKPENRDPQKLVKKLINYNAIYAKADEDGVHAYFEDREDARGIWTQLIGEKYTNRVGGFTETIDDVPIYQAVPENDIQGKKRVENYWKIMFGDDWRRIRAKEDEEDSAINSDDEFDRDIDADYKEEEFGGEKKLNRQMKDDSMFGFFNDDDY